MRKKYYLTLDCETATLPFISEWNLTSKDKQKIAIAKPLVYDLGWVISDRLGNIVKKASYLIQETFFVPNVFNTAYYKDKRPLYMDKLEKGFIKVGTWKSVTNELEEDMQNCDIIFAYNACFDFKKAIPFTERYINALYSNNYQAWEDSQRKKCKDLIEGCDSPKNETYLHPVFEFRNHKYPLCDLWGLACDRLINIDKYRNYCLDNELLTNSAIYFKTSAEISFQYLLNQHDFIEEHTALADAEIETQILTKALKKGKITPYIKEFPFRELGTTYDYVLEKRKKSIPLLAEKLEEYLCTIPDNSNYYTRIENILIRLS